MGVDEHELLSNFTLRFQPPYNQDHDEPLVYYIINIYMIT